MVSVEAEWRVLQMGVCPPIYRASEDRTSGGTLPGGGLPARASRTDASAEASTDRRGCARERANWRGSMAPRRRPRERVAEQATRPEV
ncbi:hypothetical protein Taro_034915 [Colocasia esculenta]|uniref:Uncharacterized protein n=1 Tax=Colocasia esculenta TaxID=4460 RepID=A0A843W8Z3_COLES|nr:hypothetical protein [Colocasia esculenta]